MAPTAVTAKKQLCLRQLLSACSVALVILIFCFPAHSQLNLGRIFGGITDQSGGAIVGATVTVTDVQRGVQRPLITDSSGEYSAPSLTPGTYMVRAEAKGFKAIERQDIVVGVGQDIRVDLTLEPGEQTQTVTVTGEAPQVNTTNAQLGGALENETVEELPSNGRQYTYLLNYRPGMEERPGVGPLGYSSNGQRNSAQVWMFDGLFSTNVYSGGNPIIGGAGGGAGNDQSTILPLDAVQEMNVIENPKAEYGWKPGAQVNVGLKSGTNSVHGSAYAFGRDAALVARNQFVPTKPTTNLEQFGATIGGPIKKDKLFYFAAFEGNRYDVGVAKTIQEPAALSGAGPANSLPDAIAALKAASIPLSQLSLNLAGCTSAGVCSGPSIFPNATTSQNVPNTQDTVGGSNNELVKVDYHLNDHNALNGEYFFGDGNFLTAGSQTGASAVQPYWRLALHARAQVLRGIWIFTPTSTWVNEARFGYDNTTLPASIGECTQNLGAPNYTSEFGFISGAEYCGFPFVTIQGFAGLGANSQFLISHWGNTEFSDAVSYTHGKHLFKFGFELHNILWGGGSFTNGKGTVNFNAGTSSSGAFNGSTALESFLAGKAANGQLLLGSPVRQLLIRQYAGFAQDDWAITRRLTLNLGVRYEYARPVTEPDNLIGNFSPSSPTGMIQETNGQPVYNGDPNNFGPRLGLAWDVTGKGTTVVRAGGGIVYESTDILPIVSAASGAQLPAIPTGFSLYGIHGQTITNSGTIQEGNVALTPAQINWTVNQPIYNSTPSALACGDGSAPTAPTATTLATLPSPCNIFGMDPNFKFGYVTNWTLGIQHAFTNNLSLDVAYVGNHGTKLNGDVNANSPLAGCNNTASTSCTWVNSLGAPLTVTGVPTEEQRRPYFSQFPYFGAVEIESAVGLSNYNALQTTLVQRVSHGLSFTVGYTYAHALDVSSGAGAEPMNLTRQEYGNSAYDARNHATIAGVYVIPGKKWHGQLLEGWQMSSTLNLMGAFPWSPADASDDISGTSTDPATASSYLDRWTMVGSKSDFNTFGGPAAIPCFGASTSSTFTPKNGCTVGLPAACVNAAAAEATGVFNPDLPATGANVTTGTESLMKLGCYMVGNSVIVPPALGTFGTMPRDALRGEPFREWDLAFIKGTQIREWLNTEFRIEVFNVFNGAQFASPNANLAAPASLGQSQSTPNVSNTLIGSGGPRTIQLGFKFLF